jgi:membrane associated rhomboid family serine protease
VAWVTRALLLLNLAAFVLEWRQGEALEAFLYRFGVIPSHWLGGAGLPMDWLQSLLTLFTSQFLHGGVFHLASNMLYLWIFADNVEDRLGPARFTLLYLGSGVAAALAQMLATPHATVPMVGASGAIAGVLGAYLLLFPAAKIVTLVPLGWYWETVELPAFGCLGVWVLLQRIKGLNSNGPKAHASF